MSANESGAAVNTAADANDDGFEPVDMIYAGRRELHAEGSKKIAILFYHASAPDEVAVFYSPKVVKLFRTMPLGGVVTNKRKGDTFTFDASWKRDSRDARVAQWRAADEAVDVTLRARKHIAAAREQGKDRMLEALRPFREEYAKTDHVGRLALEVVLLNALRRG